MHLNTSLTENEASSNENMSRTLMRTQLWLKAFCQGANRQRAIRRGERLGLVLAVQCKPQRQALPDLSDQDTRAEIFELVRPVRARL